MLKDLAEKAKTSKHARINKEKILTYIRALESYGTRIGAPVIKHIDGDIWELRPLDNRILFFYWKDDTFVLLHHFIKKTQKTPLRDIEQAKRNLADFLESEG
ncbi:MAG: addiction module toxin RelE [Clostridiales bacterium]|nr:MAG: addiction module toxin RelE [Clostridiales bacterium]